MYGVIDIGSNSVRLMLNDGKKTVEKQMNTTKLAENLSFTGLLAEKAMERTEKAIVDFYTVADKICDKVWVFATEAIRSAENGNEFVEKIRSIYDIDIEVVSGVKEALLGFKGAYDGGRTAVIDIGGASTEIVIGDENGIKYAKSRPIGSVRLRDLCHENEDLLNEIIDKELQYYDEAPLFEKSYIIGGVAGTVVSVIEGMTVYDTSVTHHYAIMKDELRKWYRIIKNTDYSDRDKIKGLNPNRADVIVGAMYILLKIMDKFEINEVIVSENDNLEGFLKLKLEGQI